MYFFKKKIQKLYKFLIQKLFFLFYGKISCQIEEIISIQYHNIKKNGFNYKILNIDYGRVYTDYVENVAYLKNNVILNDVSFQHVNGELKNTSYNSVIYKGTPHFVKKYKGTILSLVQGASGNNNYWHWIFDILPRLILVKECYPLNKIDFFYLPKLQKWQKDSLSIFNIDFKKVINSQKIRHIQADNIICTSHPWYKKGYILNEAKNVPKWIVEEISKKYDGLEKKFNSNQNFYIDRRDSKYNHCQIINDNEIINYLKKKNFSIYKLGELSFFEQIYLFKNAKCIIGAHGAGFANLIFCKPNTKVIDIIPENHPNSADEVISKYKLLDFNYIKTKSLNENEKKIGDIYLPLEKIQNLVY